MKASLAYRLLYKYAGFCFRLFYNVHIKGTENIPVNQPVIFAANHQNALMDALVVLFASNRTVNFLARADMFKSRFIIRVLNFLRIFPVYRPRDGVDIVEKNAEVFNNVARLLSSGECFGVMPEGTHTHFKHLQPLKKGIARMAFDAAAITEFKLKICIIPVGLDYNNYHKQGSQLLVIFGKPVDVSGYYELFKVEPNKALSQLRDNLADSLKQIMIHVEQPDEYSFITRYAEWSVLNKEESKGDPFTRFYKLKQMVDNLNTLKRENTQEFELLKNEYNHLSVLPDKDYRYDRPKQPWNTLPGRILNILISALGYAMNFVPFLLSYHLSQKAKDPQFTSSNKYGSAILLFPVWFILIFFIGTITGGLLIGTLALILTIASAIFSLKHPLI